VHGERDLWPALCWIRSSAQCLATIGAIVHAAVRSAGRAIAHNTIRDGEFAASQSIAFRSRFCTCVARHRTDLVPFMLIVMHNCRPSHSTWTW